MNYINTDNVIAAAQVVPKQSQKEHNPVKITKKLVDVRTYKRARPPIMSAKTKDNITSFQPPQRI